MNAQRKSLTLSLVAWSILLLGLAACSPAASSSSAAIPESPSPGRSDTSHTPVILRVAEREETKNGIVYFHKDMFYRDSAGDAIAVANKLVRTDPPGGISVRVSDDPITASALEQGSGTVITSTWGCPSKGLDPFSIALEERVRDRAGNLSNPAAFTVSCAANPPSNAPFLIGGTIVGLVLLLVAFRLFRAYPAQRSSTVRAVVILFCTLLPVTLILLSLHEGGHALFTLGRDSADLEIFAHPFAFSGYSRPMFEWSSVWAHAAGAVAAILGSLLISLPFWRRRSVSNFALAALFPMAAMNNGFYILTVGGDFHNIVNITGVSPVVFNVLGSVIAALGILSFLSLLPLLGLSPRDKKVLLVLPTGYFLWGLLSTIVAYLLVPGSPFVIRWHLVGEILQSANAFLAAPLMGLACAVIYLTLYRWLSPRLPVLLQSEQVSLTGTHLRLPGLLAALSMAAGLAVIL